MSYKEVDIYNQEEFMDNAALQLRKLKLKQRHACLTYKTYCDSYSMYSPEGFIEIQGSGDDHVNPIKPGEFMVHQLTGELYLFLGTGIIKYGLAEKFIWVLQETEPTPKVLDSRRLIEQFDDHYHLV